MFMARSAFHLPKLPGCTAPTLQELNVRYGIRFGKVPSLNPVKQRSFDFQAPQPKRNVVPGIRDKDRLHPKDW